MRTATASGSPMIDNSQNASSLTNYLTGPWQILADLQAIAYRWGLFLDLGSRTNGGGEERGCVCGTMGHESTDQASILLLYSAILDLQNKVWWCWSNFSFTITATSHGVSPVDFTRVLGERDGAIRPGVYTSRPATRVRRSHLANSLGLSIQF